MYKAIKTSRHQNKTFQDENPHPKPQHAHQVSSTTITHQIPLHTPLPTPQSRTTQPGETQHQPSRHQIQQTSQRALANMTPSRAPRRFTSKHPPWRWRHTRDRPESCLSDAAGAGGEELGRACSHAAHDTRWFRACCVVSLRALCVRGLGGRKKWVGRRVGRGQAVPGCLRA
jgi:hypothetical protein